MKLREFLAEAKDKEVKDNKPVTYKITDEFVPSSEVWEVLDDIGAIIPEYVKIKIRGASSIADIPFEQINDDEFFKNSPSSNVVYLDLSNTSIKDFRGFPKDSLRNYNISTAGQPLSSEDRYYNVFGSSVAIKPPKTLSSFEGLPPNVYIDEIDCLKLPIKSLKGLEHVEFGVIVIPDAVIDISDHFPRKINNTGYLVMTLKPGRLMQLHDGIHNKKTINTNGWGADFDGSLIFINDIDEISSEPASFTIASALMNNPDPFDFQEWCIENRIGRILVMPLDDK
jgi:hypothetical protein